MKVSFIIHRHAGKCRDSYPSPAPLCLEARRLDKMNAFRSPFVWPLVFGLLIPWAKCNVHACCKCMDVLYFVSVRICYPPACMNIKISENQLGTVFYQHPLQPLSSLQPPPPTLTAIAFPFVFRKYLISFLSRCQQFVLWLTCVAPEGVFGLSNVCVYVDVCHCTRRLYKHRKRDCTETELKSCVKVEVDVLGSPP